MNKKNQQINFILDGIGLTLIGLFSLGYCLFCGRFAELHLNFSFLNFPVFIGEILLFLCLVLLIVKWIINNQKFNIWYYLIFCYLGFILLKAFLGYSKWGPLAFRHSALFYYPLFAVFGYNFYRRDFFSNKMILFLTILLIFILKFIPFYRYFLIPCVILTLILIKAYNCKIIRNISICLLLIAIPNGLYLHSSRAILVSGFTTGIYLVITLAFILRLKKRYRIILSAFSVAFILFATLNAADEIAVKSIVNLKKIVNLYNEFNEHIIEREKDFKIVEINEVKLYNPDVEVNVQSEMIKAEIKELKDQMKKEQPYFQEIKQINMARKETLLELAILKANMDKISKKVGLYPQVEVQEEVSNLEELYTNIEETKCKIESNGVGDKIEEGKEQIEKFKKELRDIEDKIPKKTLPRRLQTDYGNSVLRIFIWRDMLRQMREEKSVLGIDFGKPFRSKSIEILNWAYGEWTRDGWISAHNSYVEIMYRTGALGILFVVIIFAALFKMVKKSISMRSINGILLCGILINLLVAANFAVILELPYNAIPFWSLFGITFCYLNFKIKDRRRELL